ncbi:DUF2254 domain-containing protein [Nitrosomonas communis]|uniref:DUF2254 domain-containing protein n=1 Tax=Nitrosomonas communis TaxID=44574 RepID=UPI0026EBC596|nr:DUF2254 domain-containing protein [Nitrosomonas communis]MCO6428438.1 DUF2254 domain-containing protein [Nitrosomonas communis]
MSQASRISLTLRSRVRFYLNRIREHLWVKPLVICLLSIIVAFLAALADRFDFGQSVPDISAKSIETLLSIVSTSMLVIAVFAVGAMLSAYASASSAATPRSFFLVIADDVSQNSLSVFIGAFIFSIIGLVALLNGIYDKPGRFVLFLITMIVFAMVIFTFVRWVDRIARLGRLGTTVDKVEAAARDALTIRARFPTFGAAKEVKTDGQGVAVYSKEVGYVQRIDVARLQILAEQFEGNIVVCALPGTFSAPDQPLAYVEAPNFSEAETVLDDIGGAFMIGGERTFDEDPRFGLVVLSEIASRALSPAVNDPGTAIDVIGTLVRLFVLWTRSYDAAGEHSVEFDRVAIPEISLDDMFDDAFNAISRDGASALEVAIRLQKAFHSLVSLEHKQMRQAAIAHARLALRYAELALKLPEEIEAVRRVAEHTIQMETDDDKQGAPFD